MSATDVVGSKLAEEQDFYRQEIHRELWELALLLNEETQSYHFVRFKQERNRSVKEVKDDARVCMDLEVSLLTRTTGMQTHQQGVQRRQMVIEAEGKLSWDREFTAPRAFSVFVEQKRVRSVGDSQLEDTQEVKLGCVQRVNPRSVDKYASKRLHRDGRHSGGLRAVGSRHPGVTTHAQHKRRQIAMVSAR